MVLEGEVIYSNPMKPKVYKATLPVYAQKWEMIDILTFESFVSNVDAHPLIQEGTARLKIPYPPVIGKYIYILTLIKYRFIRPLKKRKIYGVIQGLPPLLRWDDNAVNMLPEGASKALVFKKCLTI